jgi:flagellar hook-associated protein 1 FlgK
MSLDLALNAARSGLSATQRALGQASQNIANAATPGYTRKTVLQEAMTDGDMPLGVRTGAVQRSVDAALVARIDASRSTESGAELRERLLRGIEQTQGIGAGTEALPDAVSALRDRFIALRGSPDDTGLQRSATDAAQDAALALNTLSTAIGTARNGAQSAIEAEVNAVNAALREIAALTVKLKAGVDGPGAAAIEDQRDVAVARLSESIEVRAVRQPGGDLLLLSRGAALLPLDPDRDLFAVAPANIAPGSYYGTGGTLPAVTLQGLDVTSQLSGGRLGEAIQLRDRLLPRMQAEVDLVATHLAGRLDALGLRLFTDTGSAAPPAMVGAYQGSAQIGFAGRILVNPAVVADTRLLRDGTQAVAATPGGPTAFTPNPVGGPAGFVTMLNRVLDFGFGANAAPGAPWAPIPVSGLGPDGSLASPFLAPATLDAYASRVVSTQAADRAAATAAKTDAATLRGALTERFARQSGVDVDAELGAMVALQNAYAANARVLSTVQAMWDQLLSSVR